MDDQGLHDVAIMLMSLGEEEAAEVFKHFSPKEVQKLGETIARMRSVSREKVDEVINKFSNAAAAQSLLVSDTGNYVRAVLKRALGDDKAGLLIDRILQGGDVSGIESLSGWTRCQWLNFCVTSTRRLLLPSWYIWTATRPRAS
jgi:flagellar motor switch protein FliG